MSEPLEEDNVSLISKGLYRRVSDIVGPECIVKLRRWQWYNVVTRNLCDSGFNINMMISGSRAEGFKFEGSDYDCMSIERKAIVVPSPLYMTRDLYDKKITVLQMETENTTPGFTFLKVLACDINNEYLYKNLISRKGSVYVSSKQIREKYMSTNTSSNHGPCQTSIILGEEYDFVFTLMCPVWPSQAASFIHRSLEQGWPLRNTLTDICKDGFLLVPINSKQQHYSDMMDLEWRISFSLAEKKLVHSMNHCQFLCYGLSKIFLNECLKNVLPDKDDLCSYFMKTAVFWEISDNSSDWVPSNFLSKFWNVFKRLIKWMSTGYCPNFFIPENNMFRGKIYGEKQQTVLQILRELYNDGYRSLLRCTSLTAFFSFLITHPEIAHMIPYDENVYVPKSRIEKERLKAYFCFDRSFNIEKTHAIMRTLINTLISHTESEDDVVIKRLSVNFLVQNYAERVFLSSRFSSISTMNNMTFYMKFRKFKNLLYRTRTSYCRNYFILIKNLYMTGNYERMFEMIHYIKYRLQSQPFMYLWNLNDKVIMTALHQGMSYDTVIKSFIVSLVQMSDQTSIKELKLEVEALIHTTSASVLFLPPLVFLNFILFLSYTKLGEYHRRRDALEELHSILHNDDGQDIMFKHKAISWQILGICQQLYGDSRGALQSYIYAFHDKYNEFRIATIARIDSLDNRLSIQMN